MYEVPSQVCLHIMSSTSVTENDPAEEVGSNGTIDFIDTKRKLQLEIDTAVLKNWPSDNICMARKGKLVLY